MSIAWYLQNMILERLKRYLTHAVNLAFKTEFSAFTAEQYKTWDALKMQHGKILTNQLAMMEHQVRNLHDAEFKVFSQFGDDGIIQYLVRKFPNIDHSFIEFGVEDYRESNTRFLLMNNNWRGLVIDSDPEYVKQIKNDAIHWLHELHVKEAFITRDNINSLLTNAGFTGNIGILSIDIDGNDHWIWEAINVVQPVIVIIEYNSLFGSKDAVTIPYDPTFNRMNAHWSGLYWGCSLQALRRLAEIKGYSLVGCNSAGNNAYFVRTTLLNDGLQALTAEQGYVRSRYRECRNEHGELSFLNTKEQLALIGDLPIYDTNNECSRTINSLDLGNTA